MNTFSAPVVLHARLVSVSVLPRLPPSGPIGPAHSVFEHALNVADAEGLVAVVDATVGAVPNGVVLAPAASLASIRPGDLVAVDVARAERWSPRLAVNVPVLHPELVRATWRRLGARPGLPSTHAGIEGLRRAHQAADLPRMLEAAQRLIGLGPGLTPAGDDVLIGFSAALWSSADPSASAFSAACADLAAQRTTDVAREFYRSAARGEFSARLHQLVPSVVTATDPATLTAALEHALDWGATSGADTLLGLLLGLLP